MHVPVSSRTPSIGTVESYLVNVNNNFVELSLNYCCMQELVVTNNIDAQKCLLLCNNTIIIVNVFVSYKRHDIALYV